MALHPRRLIPLALPLVWAWSAWKRREAARLGRPLTPHELSLAARVGVREPHRIRMCRVAKAPFPFARLVDRVAAWMGLPGTSIDGVTLGDAIFLCGSSQSDMLIAHECRHVAQFEQAGSLWAFLRRYLVQVAAAGYADAAYERDARRAAARALGRPAPD